MESKTLSDKREYARKIFEHAKPKFLALGDTNRQHIILLLCKFQSLGVNELTAKSHLSRPAISHHLKILQYEGFLTVTKIGTRRKYSLALQDGINLLSELVVAMKEL